MYTCDVHGYNHTFCIQCTQSLYSPDGLTSSLSIQSHSAQLMSEIITVQLKWTISLSQIYYQQLLQNVSIDVVPDTGVIMAYTGNRTLQLTLQYNTLYNVNLTQPGICGQPNQTAFIELKYMYSTYHANDIMIM